MMFDDVRLCPVMPGYARLCSMMFGYVRLLNDMGVTKICRWPRLPPGFPGILPRPDAAKPSFDRQLDHHRSTRFSHTPMISDDVRLSPMIRGDARSLRLPGRFGTVCRAASGPTIRLSRAAGRASIEHHGIDM